MNHERMMIGMLKSGLRIGMLVDFRYGSLRKSLDNPQIITDGKRHGQNVYLLKTDTDMKNYGFTDASLYAGLSHLSGKNCYFLGVGLEASYLKIVDIVRLYTEKEYRLTSLYCAFPLI